MRVLDCECGHTVQAANDEELRAAFADHLREQHPADSGQEPAADEIELLVSKRAYDATDS